MKDKQRDLALRIEAAKDTSMELVCTALGLEYNEFHHQRCPMVGHQDDNTPSCKFYKNNSFACFGCKKGGSTIDLVMGVKSLHFAQALFWIETNVMRVRTRKTTEKNPLKERIQKAKKKLESTREKDSQDSFDAWAFRSLIGHMATENIRGIKQRTDETSLPFLEKIAEEIYAQVDQLYGNSSWGECQVVRQFVEYRLSTLCELVDCVIPEHTAFEQEFAVESITDID